MRKKAYYAFPSHLAGPLHLLALLASGPQSRPKRLRARGIRWRNVGGSYSPASGNTSNLPQALVKHYDKEFIEGLHTETPFPRCATPKDLPMKSGNQYVLFLNVPYGGNTNQTSEGTVGGGITPSVLTNTATIGEYADYINFSSYALFTAIDDTVVAQAKELAYRLAVTLSLLTRNITDTMNTIDSSVKVLLSATSISAFTVNSIGQIRSSVQSMAGRSIKPFIEGKARFAGVIHPFTWGDCINDTTNNSAVDILKHTPEGLMRLDELPSTDLADVFELPGTGVDFFQSNLVTQTPNYNDGTHGAITGLTALRTYLYGKDGVIRVTLNAPGDTAYGDGSMRNVRCFTEANAGPTKSDPSGLIPGWTSYRCHYVATPSPDTIMRVRYIDAASGVS